MSRATQRSLRDAIVPILDRCFRTGGILSYHAVVERGEVPSPAMHISVAALERQLAYVRGHYDVLPLSELIERHRRRRSTNRCMAITFDDAYVGVARLAAPLLRTLDLPATIFVTVGASERAGTYWWDAIEHARRHDAARWAAIARAVGMSAAEPDVTSIGAMRDRILVRRAGRFVAEGTEPPPMLRASSFEELRTLAEDARFEFGCHTLTHPALPLLPPAEQECEIHVAHLRLQKELPRVMPVVAYPFGLYDDATIRAAQRAGLAAGVTMQPRALDARDTVFALPRIGVSEDWTESAIALRANAALRSLFIARMGGRHPRLPADPRQAVV